MTPDDVISQLEVHAHVFAHIFNGVEAEQAGWKPSPEEWSLLEVVCHLGDEERLDFRTRVDYILHRPADEWPPIRPQEWVVEKGYNQRDFDASVLDLLRERRLSLDWLHRLGSADWSSTHVSRHGAFTALEMLNAWLAHDYLHLRQINELKWKWLARGVPPLPLDYAGGW